MIKYQIRKGRHYVYNYADKTWHDFDDKQEAFDFMSEVLGV